MPGVARGCGCRPASVGGPGGGAVVGLELFAAGGTRARPDGATRAWERVARVAWEDWAVRTHVRSGGRHVSGAGAPRWRGRKRRRGLPHTGDETLGAWPVYCKCACPGINACCTWLSCLRVCPPVAHPFVATRDWSTVSGSGPSIRGPVLAIDTLLNYVAGRLRNRLLGLVLLRCQTLLVFFARLRELT